MRYGERNRVSCILVRINVEQQVRIINVIDY